MTLPSTITDGDIPTQGRVKALVASNARATASSYAAIPAALDQLRVNSTGNSVLGQLISDVALGRTYRVDSEPSYGTAGTTANYTLTGISQPGDPTIAASLIPQMSQALVDNAQATAGANAAAAFKPDALAAAAAKPDALAAAAAKPDAQAAAALLPPLSAANATAISDHNSTQAALATLNAIPTNVKGLRVNNSSAAPNGGQLWDFTSDSTAVTAATFAAGTNGGLIYDLTGGV
jgi:hypothetical protein